MTRALVVTLPEKGHYHPLLGPAAELERQGAEVAFAVGFDIREELEDAGVHRVFVAPGAAPPPAGLRGAQLAAVLADPGALRGWIKQLLVEGAAASTDEMRAIIRDFRPNVVAIDTMAYAGAIAAELERVPWVGWSTSLNPVVPDDLDSELIRTLRALDPDRRAVFAEYGLSPRFRVSDVLSPNGTAVFATEALVGSAPASVRLVGPSLGGTRSGTPVDYAFARGRPLLYVSFGSQAWYQPRRFDIVLEAACTLDVAVLAAMGDLADEYRRLLPSHIRCVRFAPQLDVLDHARLLITHGGANSVMEGIAKNVPILVSPICNDQPHNRYFVERAGVGAGIDLDRCSVADLVDAMTRLLADGRVRATTAHAARSYAARSGERGAAELARSACR